MKTLFSIIPSILLCSFAFGQTKESTPKKPFSYTEISIKEGGTWQDGKRGHKEYVGGTFKNVKQVSTPAEHTDHSFYIRYEGPGLENNQVAYRIYLDWRNAIDIFGKKVDQKILPMVGQDGFENYHHDADWGQDIFKAGKSLGIGSYGKFDNSNDEVIHFKEVKQTDAKVINKKKKSFVKIDYKGWKALNSEIDLNAKLTIFPRDRFLKIDLKTSQPTDNLCTGIANFKDITFFSGQSENKDWAYIATYGKQTIAGENDLLGLVIFYKTSQVKELKDTALDHLILFKDGVENIQYYLAAAWDKEKNGIRNETDFLKYIQDNLNQLSVKGKL